MHTCIVTLHWAPLPESLTLLTSCPDKRLHAMRVNLIQSVKALRYPLTNLNRADMHAVPSHLCLAHPDSYSFFMYSVSIVASASLVGHQHAYTHALLAVLLFASWDRLTDSDKA